MSQPRTRSEYIAQCRREVETHTHQPMDRLWHTFIRKGGQKVGVVIVHRHQYDKAGRTAYWVGWSLCDMKRDKFDRWIALAKAFSRALPITALEDRDIQDVPHSARRLFKQMAHFAWRLTTKDADLTAAANGGKPPEPQAEIPELQLS